MARGLDEDCLLNTARTAVDTGVKDIDSWLDIGIHHAPWSTTGGVEKLVAGEALWLPGLGLLLGVAGSVALRSVIAGQFYCA